MEKLIQIYEDDPIVNWDILKKHFQHQEEGEISSVIELGSFGLQIVHGALQTGMTRPGWNLYIVLNDCGIFLASHQSEQTSISEKHVMCFLFTLVEQFGLKMDQHLVEQLKFGSELLW